MPKGQDPRAKGQGPALVMGYWYPERFFSYSFLGAGTVDTVSALEADDATEAVADDSSALVPENTCSLMAISRAAASTV